MLIKEYIYFIYRKQIIENFGTYLETFAAYQKYNSYYNFIFNVLYFIIYLKNNLKRLFRLCFVLTYIIYIYLINSDLFLLFINAIC